LKRWPNYDIYKTHTHTVTTPPSPSQNKMRTVS